MIDEKKENRRYMIISWLLCFVLIIIAEVVYKKTSWQYDACDYWTRGEALKNAKFNLGAIDGFRGYIFPLVLGIANYIGGKKAWYIINAAVFSSFFTFVIPNIGQNYKYSKKGFIRIIVADILIGVLFVGLLAYPLSDMFAAMCCCCSIVFARKSLESQNFTKYMYVFGMGAFGYFAYNTRTIYLFALIVVFIMYVLISVIRKRKYIMTMLNCLIGMIGVLCASIPQIIMNYINLKIINIGVPTNGLMLMQMFWGIKYQRYDTYIPIKADAVHPSPQVIFDEPTGLRILNELQLSQFDSWGDLFEVIFSYPVDVAVIYFKHFINFLFPCWPQVYADNLNSSKWIFGLIGASILFLAVLVFFEKCVVNYKSLIYYLPFIIPAILIIPGAVEFRFSLPFYIFGISQLACNVDYIKLKTSISGNKMKVVIAYLTFILMCFTIWSNMLANESVTPLLF